MHQHKIRGIISIALLALTTGVSLGAPPADDDAKMQVRRHWENLVTFYGDEETGEWSLRIQDKDVKSRAWFEFLEMWHFNREEKRWEEVKNTKTSKAIVLPSQKTTDEPPDSQVLVMLTAIEPKTAGVWYAKWKVDEVEGSTLMRVGSARAKPLPGPTPHGMVKLVIPIDLNKSEDMLVPDPHTYCVTGGPGKPEANESGKDGGKKGQPK